MTKKEQLCLKCLECCKSIAFTTNLKSDDVNAVEFYKARGFDIYPALNGNLTVSININCPHLSSLGCGIYNKRPANCVGFDGRNSVVTKDKCLWNMLE